MVDRYKSIVDHSSIHQQDKLPKNLKLKDLKPDSNKLVELTNSHPTKLRKIMNQYKRTNNSGDSEELIAKFNLQQRELVEDRKKLKIYMDRNCKDSTPEHNYIKKEVLRSIKNELDLELELSHEVTKRKKEKEMISAQLLKGSQKLKNALADIMSKKEQIIHLERTIKECLQLLDVLGVLVMDQGYKIDQIEKNVHQAFINIEKAEQNIDKAVIRMEKAKNKCCCIIVLALIAIAGILAMLFGFSLVSF